MGRRLGFAFVVLCAAVIFAMPAYAQQAAEGVKPPVQGNGPGPGEGHGKESGQAAQLRQEIQALEQQAQPLRAQLQQLEAQAKPIREQLRPLREKIKLDHEKLMALREGHKEHRKDMKEQKTTPAPATTVKK